MNDPINPSHYDNIGTCSNCGESIDAIDITVNRDFLEGNILKYLLRYKTKGGLEDLHKAEWYLVRLIDRVAADSLMDIQLT